MPTFLPTFTLKHFANWGLSIWAPYVILIAGFIFLKTHRNQETFEKVFDVGYDSCILGIGIAAALLGGSEFQEVLQNNAAWIPLVFGLFVMALLYGAERSQYDKVTQSRWSVFAGTLIFGFCEAVFWLGSGVFDRTEIEIHVSALAVLAGAIASTAFKIRGVQLINAVLACLFILANYGGWLWFTARLKRLETPLYPPTQLNQILYGAQPWQLVFLLFTVVVLGWTLRLYFGSRLSAPIKD